MNIKNIKINGLLFNNNGYLFLITTNNIIKIILNIISFLYLFSVCFCYFIDDMFVVNSLCIICIQ